MAFLAAASRFCGIPGISDRGCSGASEAEPLGMGLAGAVQAEFGQLRKFRNGNRHIENAAPGPSDAGQSDGRHAVPAAPFGLG
jgi:hypothetical protein